MLMEDKKNADDIIIIFKKLTGNKESDKVIKQFFIVQISVFIYRLQDISENI